MNFIPQEDIQWKTVKYLRQGESRNYDYELILNEPLASWDVWDYWERPRIESMQRHLEYGDTLFDIGTEQGWCNLVYAKLVGPQNIVLIEPTKEFWPNIRAVWEKNFEVPPLFCFEGFFDIKTRDDFEKGFNVWERAIGPIIDRNKYQYIHDNVDNVTSIELDRFVDETGIVPDAITIDTEGSELLILKGSEKTLKENDVKIWVSIHDDLGRRDYNTAPEDTIKYLESLGYKGQLLGVDHEAHWYFRKLNK